MHCHGVIRMYKQKHQKKICILPIETQTRGMIVILLGSSAALYDPRRSPGARQLCQVLMAASQDYVRPSAHLIGYSLRMWDTTPWPQRRPRLCKPSIVIACGWNVMSSPKRVMPYMRSTVRWLRLDRPTATRGRFKTRCGGGLYGTSLKRRDREPQSHGIHVVGFASYCVKSVENDVR